MKTSDFIGEIPFSSGCEVIRFEERSGLIAINKKAGRATHPNLRSSPWSKPPMLKAQYNFERECYSWISESGENLCLYLVNRLDSPTSGIVIAADNEKSATDARNAFKKRLVSKLYCAIVVGRSLPRHALWSDKIFVERRENFVRAVSVSGRDSRTAVCDCELISYDSNNAGLALLHLKPLTGLTHQLRIQCAKHGCPILGDATYGNFLANKKLKTLSKINRLFLHCAKTSFEVDCGGENIQFEAESPVPDSFSKIMSFNKDIAKGFCLL